MCVFFTWHLWICDDQHKSQTSFCPSQVVFACLHEFSAGWESVFLFDWPRTNVHTVRFSIYNNSAKTKHLFAQYKDCNYRLLIQSIFLPNQCFFLHWFLYLRPASSEYCLPPVPGDRCNKCTKHPSLHTVSLLERCYWHCAGHIVCMPKWTHLHEKQANILLLQQLLF